MKKPYRPRPQILTRAKAWIQEDTIEVGNKKYAIISCGLVDTIILREMMQKGFLGPKRKFSDVLEEKGEEWDVWRQDFLDGRRSSCPHFNTSVYEVLKDIADFVW